MTLFEQKIKDVDDYQFEATKTMIFKDKKEDDQYCCMKLAEEVGELTGMIAKHYHHGKAFDRQNLIEEIGDIMWYCAVLAQNNGVPMSEITTENIKKLRKRHGVQYNEDYYKDK